MDKLAAMRAFVAIVDEGSLTAAAAALGKAPPSMVRILATLEAHLGVPLLHRTTRRMSLTEEGRVYLDRCRRILADVDEAEQAVAADGAEPRGEIRATAPILFGRGHVAPAVAEFVRRHPGVRVELLLLDRVVDLVEEGIDVGVRIGRLPDSSLIAVPVGQVRRVVVASPALLRRGAPRHPSELAALPCVEHLNSGTAGRWSFRDADRERDLTVRVRSAFACNQAAAIVQACVEGLGVGRFLSYQVEPEVRAGSLRVLLEAFEPEPVPVQLVYPGARWMSARLRAFVDELGAKLQARPEIRKASPRRASR
ncbi:LysR family transcriptional regulator [Nannocystis punicea]|uniref:LysR family transcriptional regulator n=1 Tax=Nannocystis punicea TaxID=2995304 RepID=A0ABY7GV52_9BACT|nr:LysR family transcriptional regulator [Nannocystis poenicansa]WAS90851.1 LysR family transcriptional regulator [Nannocystis poenicansa]